jgi:hypothetical protein
MMGTIPSGWSKSAEDLRLPSLKPNCLKSPAIMEDYCFSKSKYTIADFVETIIFPLLSRHIPLGSSNNV